MSVDAGTIYSGVRVKLDALNRDVKAVQSEFDKISGAVGKTKSSTNALNNEFSKLTKSIVSGQLVYDGIKRAMGAVVDFTKEAITASIDAQETFGKYDEVFKGMGEQSEEAAQRFAKAFDLAGVTAKDMLSNTGNLLQGFGATKRESLEMAESVNTLASDLASFTNYSGGAKGASEALTKALLGERESAKGLGIAILESDVQVELARKGQQGLTGEALKLAKAQATLEIITRQAKNSIGDYARTSDSASNTLKRAKESTLELKVALGTTLNGALRTASNLWTGIAEAISETIKRSTGVGNLEVATSDLVKTSREYNSVVKTLATDSDTLAVSERGVLEARKDLLASMIQQQAIDLAKAYSEEQKELNKSTKATVEKSKELDILRKRQDELKVLSADIGKAWDKLALDEKANYIQLANSSAEYASSAQRDTAAKTIMAQQLSNELKTTQKNILNLNGEYLSASSSLDTFKNKNQELIFSIARAVNDGSISIEQFGNTSNEAYTKFYNDVMAATVAVKGFDEQAKKQAEADAKAAKAAKNREEQLKIEQDQINARKEAEKKYQDALAFTNYQLENGLSTNADANKANLDAATKYIDALYKLGYASESEIGTIGYNALQSLIEKYPELIALTKEAKNETESFGLGFEELAKIQQEFVKTGIDGFNSVFYAMAEAIATGEDVWGAFAKSGLNAIASIIEAIGGQLAAQAALSIASAWSTGGFSLTGAGPAIAGSAAAYTTAGLIRGWAGSFETGGIVPGTSYTGDNMLASVNSGEMILNQQQQARLWNELSGLRNGANGGNITVVSVLDGKKVSRSVTRRQRTNNA